MERKKKEKKEKKLKKKEKKSKKDKSHKKRKRDEDSVLPGHQDRKSVGSEPTHAEPLFEFQKKKAAIPDLRQLDHTDTSIPSTDEKRESPKEQKRPLVPMSKVSTF